MTDDDYDGRERAEAMEMAQDRMDEERAALYARIAVLEKQNDRFVTIIAACDERGEVGRTVDALAECRIRLHVATETNVADRKRIAELEAGLLEAIGGVESYYEDQRCSSDSLECPYTVELRKLMPSGVLGWIMAHPELRKQYAGQYVAVSERQPYRVVAAHTTLEVLLQIVDASDVYIHQFA